MPCGVTDTYGLYIPGNSAQSVPEFRSTLTSKATVIFYFALIQNGLANSLSSHLGQHSEHLNKWLESDVQLKTFLTPLVLENFVRSAETVRRTIEQPHLSAFASVQYRGVSKILQNENKARHLFSLLENSQLEEERSQTLIIDKR